MLNVAFKMTYEKNKNKHFRTLEYKVELQNDTYNDNFNYVNNMNGIMDSIHTKLNGMNYVYQMPLTFELQKTAPMLYCVIK